MSTKTDKQASKQFSSSVHFTLQGKGGVGKSLISVILAQYFKGIDGVKVNCIDTDPVNQTMVSFKSLDAQHVKLMVDGSSRIDERNFDQMVERVLSEDGVFVIDNGSSSFVPLSNYLLENNVLAMLHEAGREVFIHCVIAGGQSLTDTMTGFKALAEQADTKNIVIWLNEFFGPIVRDGKQFDEMRAYQDNKNKVCGIVRLPPRNPDTSGKDIQIMASQKLTFAEVLSGSEFSIMAKQRIKTVQKDIFSQLAEVKF